MQDAPYASRFLSVVTLLLAAAIAPCALGCGSSGSSDGDAPDAGPADGFRDAAVADARAAGDASAPNDASAAKGDAGDAGARDAAAAGAPARDAAADARTAFGP